MLTDVFFTAMSSDEEDHAQQSGPEEPLGIDFIATYAPLQFQHQSVEWRRCRKYVRMAHGRHRCVDWQLLDQLGERARAMQYIGEDSPWFRLFDIPGIESHRELDVEFLSTFQYRPRPDDFVEPPPDDP